MANARDIQKRMKAVGNISRITKTQNVPLTSPVEVGAWALLAIQDNGSGQGSPDKATSATGLPSFLTLEQIKQFIQGAPAPDDWFPLVGGNFTIH